MCAFVYIGQKQFPDAAAEQTPHRIHPAIPAVEIAHDTDALRVRRPDREVNALGVADFAQVRAELVVEPQMISLGKQMQVHLAHDEPVAVGIADERRRFIPTREMNVIIDVAFHPGKRRLEKSFRAESVRGETLFGLSVGNNAHFFCVRTKDAHDEIVADAMRAENPEWIGMRAGEEDVEFVDEHAGYFEGAHARITNLERGATMSCADFPSFVAASLCEA